MKIGPFPIDKAIKDGRDYILWDAKYKEWGIGAWSITRNKWVMYENVDAWEVEITHFIEYIDPDNV